MRKRALRIISGLGGVVAILAITPSIGFAQAYEPTTQDILNNIWVFMAGVLVFFMQAGFALVEAGLTRAKNVVNIFAKNMADASSASSRSSHAASPSPTAVMAT